MSTITGNQKTVTAKVGRGKKAAAAATGERVALKVKETHPPLPSKVKTMMVGLLWFLDAGNIVALATANSPDIGDDAITELVQTAAAIRDLLPTFGTVEEQIEFFEPAKDVVTMYKQHVKIPVAERKKAATAQRKRDIAAEKAAMRAAAGKPSRKTKGKKAPEPEPVPEPESDASDNEASGIDVSESIFGRDSMASVADSTTITEIRAAASQKSFEEDTRATYAEAEAAVEAEVEEEAVEAVAEAVAEVPALKEKKFRKPRAPATNKKNTRVENVY